MSEQNTQLSRIESRINKSVSASTGLTQTGAMAFSSVEQIMEFAKVMAIAGVAVPKHLREQVGACLAVAIQASEWQMSPFAVASKTYVVNDRIAFEAQLVNAVILRRAPIKGRFKISYSGEGANRRCKVSATLIDGDEVDYESPTIGTIPVKNSPLWKGDPDQQLFYYSSRAMCRRHFPDVILGIYTPDEMEDAMDIQATVTQIPQGRVGTMKDAAPTQVVKAAPEEKTVTELAHEQEQPPAAEEQQTQTINPKPVKNDAPKGPSQKDLLKEIQALGSAQNVGQKKIFNTAKSLGWIEGEELASLEDLSTGTLQAIVDGWEEVMEKIKNP